MPPAQTPLWTRAEIEEALAKINGGVEVDGADDFAINGIEGDSRAVKAGDLFVARKGEVTDGHNYLAGAFKAGATAAFVRKDYVRPNKPEAANWNLIRVDDPDAALIALGQAARKRFKGKIIAVTGSAGKTGTKEMLATALGALGKTHASQKSYNNHVGVPLTLALMPRDAVYAVIEMGMNHAGELSQLTQQVRPHIAIVTTIEPAHIEHFGTLEKIADAKAEIFEGLTADNNGNAPVAILNCDNPMFARLKAAASQNPAVRVLAFGEDDHADTRLIDCALHADSSKITADVTGDSVRMRLNIPGKHIAQNALAVLTAIKTAGGNLPKAVAALESAQAVGGRGARITLMIDGSPPPVTLIDESYNANPGSMRAALDTFAITEPAPGGKRIAVLGDMLELGKDGPRLHAELANAVLHAKVDQLFCCGPQMEALYQTLPQPWRGAHTPDSKALVAPLLAVIKPGDVILVKGSLGSKMAYIVEALQALNTASTGSNAKPKDNKNAL